MNTSVLVKLKKHPQDLWAENAEPMTHMSLRGLNLSYFRYSTKELVSSSSSAAVNSIVTCWHVRTFWFKFFTNHRASSHHRLWSYLRFYIIALIKSSTVAKQRGFLSFKTFIINHGWKLPLCHPPWQGPIQLHCQYHLCYFHRTLPSIMVQKSGVHRAGFLLRWIHSTWYMGGLLGRCWIRIALFDLYDYCGLFG